MSSFQSIDFSPSKSLNATNIKSTNIETRTLSVGGVEIVGGGESTETLTIGGVEITGGGGLTAFGFAKCEVGITRGPIPGGIHTVNSLGSGSAWIPSHENGCTFGTESVIVDSDGVWALNVNISGLVLEPDAGGTITIGLHIDVNGSTTPIIAQVTTFDLSGATSLGLSGEIFLDSPIAGLPITVNLGFSRGCTLEVSYILCSLSMKKLE